MTTRVGVVSDTHLPRFGRALPAALEDGLGRARVSRILHLGDFTELIAVELFEGLAPFDAVAGNNDPRAIRERFGRRKVVTIDGVRIGMIHGDEGPGRSAHENALAAFAPDDVAVVLYGHSHCPRVQRHAGVIVANPGSPTDKRMMPLYSYGVLTISDGRARFDLRFYASKAPHRAA